MILIAAIAIGGAASRAFLVFIHSGRPVFVPVMSWIDWAIWTLPAAYPPLLAVAVGLMICRFKRPRTTFARLRSEPGSLACIAWIGVATIQGGMFGIACGLHSAFRLRSGQIPMLLWLPYRLGNAGGIAVAATWIVLAATRRWRPDSSWIDRSGRLLGSLMIALLGVENMIFYISR